MWRRTRKRASARTTRVPAAPPDHPSPASFPAVSLIALPPPRYACTRSVFEKLGARVVVDGSSLELLDGATVDFKDEMAKSAFIVSENPMSGASCGCGTSFTAKE